MIRVLGPVPSFIHIGVGAPPKVVSDSPLTPGTPYEYPGVD